MHMRMHMYIIMDIIALLSFFIVLSPFPFCWVYDISSPAHCQVRRLYLHCFFRMLLHMQRESFAEGDAGSRQLRLRSTSSASLRAEAAAMRSAAGTSSGGNSS